MLAIAGPGVRGILLPALLLAGLALPVATQADPPRHGAGSAGAIVVTIEPDPAGKDHGRTTLRFVRPGKPTRSRRVTVESGVCRAVSTAPGKSYSEHYDLTAPAGAGTVAICRCAEGPGEMHLAPVPGPQGVRVLARHVLEGGGLFVSRWVVLRGRVVDACDSRIDSATAPEDPAATRRAP
jgi:hypothetical protein